MNDFEFDKLDKLGSTLLTISFYSNLIILVVVGTSRLLNLKSAKRLSFRLSMWVAISDLLYVLSNQINYFLVKFYPDDYDYLISNNWIISFLTFNLPLFTNLWYIFLVTGMAANLHHSFVGRTSNRFNFTELSIVSISLISVLIIGITIGLVSYLLNTPNYLELYEPGGMLLLLVWAQGDLWIFLCILYSSWVIYGVLKILLKFRKDIRYSTDINSPTLPNPRNFFTKTLPNRRNFFTKPFFSTNSSTTTNSTTIPAIGLRRRLNHVALRVASYPLVPILTQSIILGTSSYFALHDARTDMTLYYLQIITNNLAGILNAIVFCFDPALPDLYHQLIKKFKSTSSSSSDHHPIRDASLMSETLNDDMINIKPITDITKWTSVPSHRDPELRL